MAGKKAGPALGGGVVIPFQRIAVVDDNRVFLDLAAAVLETAGYETIRCDAYQFAFEAISQLKADLVIVALHQDRADEGWGLVQALRLSSATIDVPIVLTSVDRFSSKQFRLEELGCSVLEQPFSTRELVDVVRIELDRGRIRQLRNASLAYAGRR